MDATCRNCKFYTPIEHRGQRYPKGFCEKHFAYRVSDGYKTHLSITSYDEYLCDLHEPKPEPIYALVEDKLILIPPIIANELISKGWTKFALDKDTEKIVIKKDE